MPAPIIPTRTATSPANTSLLLWTLSPSGSCYDSRCDARHDQLRGGANSWHERSLVGTPMTKHSSPLAELPGTDVLADVLGALQPQGRVFCRLVVTGEWAFTMPDDGLARFHVIEQGACWVGTADGASRQ